MIRFGSFGFTWPFKKVGSGIFFYKSGLIAGKAGKVDIFEVCFPLLSAKRALG